MPILKVSDFFQALKHPEFKFYPWIIAQSDKTLDVNYNHIYCLLLFVRRGKTLTLARVPADMKILIFWRMIFGDKAELRVTRFSPGSVSHSTKLHF